MMPRIVRDRQGLLGHRSSRITTRYSAAELESLIAAAEKAACGADFGKSSALVLLKSNDHAALILKAEVGRKDAR